MYKYINTIYTITNGKSETLDSHTFEIDTPPFLKKERSTISTWTKCVAQS